jgi:peptide/nickel transport system permease protein
MASQENPERSRPRRKKVGRLGFLTGGVEIHRNAEMIIGGGIVALFMVVSLVVGIAELLHIQITPYNPIQQNVGPVLSPPSFSHLFGTDQFGRDVFSRILAAAPYGFSIGLVVVGVSIVVGITVGCIAGFRGGLFDEALMRTTDIFFAIPGLILAMAIVARLGPGLFSVTSALVIVWWPAYARLSRGETLKVSHQNYIEASRISGFGTLRIMVSHLIPNIFLTLIVYATLDLGTVVLFYAGLSYLGLSIPPPAPDWGYMVSSSQDYLISAPYLPLIPGGIIALGAVAFALFGDGFRDALEEGSI